MDTQLKENRWRFRYVIWTLALVTASCVQSGAVSSQPAGGTVGQGRQSGERAAPANEKDLNMSKIEGLYMRLTYNLTGIGGSLSMTYTPYLLLKDGTIYKRLTAPPADLDVEKSRQEEPRMWGRWEKTGTSIIVQWNDGKRENWNNQWYLTRPARKTDRLNGLYSFLTGGGTTSGMVADDIKFSGDGRFARKASASVLNNPAYVHQESDSSGTYALDGHTLELRYANGKIERRTFYFFPDSDENIGIGERVYTLRN
jgi:hypothetical protein